MAPFSDLQRREVFHLCFLERLLKVSDPKLYVLKGGVNLRFYFNSPRYSEDMDLDVLGGSVSTLKKNGYKILADKSFARVLKTYGIAEIVVNDPEKAKHSETTQRFRVRLITESGVPLPSKIEFSRRKASKLQVGVDYVDAEIARTYRKLAFSCCHYSGESAVVQKIRALGGRPTTQARDVFDLVVLQRGGFVKTVEMSGKLSGKEVQAALECLLAIEFEQYSGQVLEFIDPDARKLYASRQAWDQMVDSTYHFLQSLAV